MSELETVEIYGGEFDGTTYPVVPGQNEVEFTEARIVKPTIVEEGDPLPPLMPVTTIWFVWNGKTNKGGRRLFEERERVDHGD